jgi:hypothetical protein
MSRRAAASLTLVLTVVLLAGAAHVRAADPLRAGLGDVAGRIKEFLDASGEGSVAVGAFTGPPQMPSAAGPGFAKVLTEELTRRKVVVKRSSRVAVSGIYRAVDVDGAGEASGKGLAALVKTRVEDQAGATLVEFDCRITDPAAVAYLFGLTFQSPGPSSADPSGAKGGGQALWLGYHRPAANVRGSVVTAAPGSPYGIEILVRPAGQTEYVPRTAVQDDGLSYVPLRRGEEYAVRLINNADHEAAVQLHIDGLSWLAFGETEASGPKPTYVFLKPRSSTRLEGWYINEREVRNFVITHYAETAVAQTNANPDKIGAITATFAACWPRGGEPPADEGTGPAVARGSPLRGLPDGTGLGSSSAATFERVRDLPVVGRVRAAVTVRYDR